METNKQTEGGELYGNSEQLKPRPINTLKPTEAIQVNNDAERDGILKLMEAEGWEWNSGETAKEVIINNSYPYALAYKFEGTDGFSNKGIRIIDLDYDGQVSFLPASDFLPTEPKAEQSEEKGIEFKKGDYVRGLMVGFDKEEEGEIVDFYRSNEELFVNTGFYLETSTCRHVPRPSKTNEPIWKPSTTIDYKFLFHQAQSKVDELQAKVEDLNDSYEFDRAQAKKHREILRSKMIDYAKGHPSSHSAQLLGELILDGLI